MKKSYLLIGIPILLLLLFFGSMFGFNNNAVRYQETAKTALSNVESSYQRRADLIGNLVKTVKGAADFERTTLNEVISARAKASSTKLNVADLSAESLANFQAAQSGLNSALSRLLVTVERYPDLKSNQNFLELQSQLEGTENRINIARDRYNASVNVFNTHIKIFPNSIYAGWFGFTDELERFQSNPGSEQAPDIEFDF